MGTSGIVHVLLSTVLILTEGNSCITIGLLVFAISLVSLIRKDECHSGGCPLALSSFGRDTSLSQISRNFRSRPAIEICVIYPAHDFRFRLIHSECFVNEAESIGSIAVHILASIHSLHDREPLML